MACDESSYQSYDYASLHPVKYPAYEPKKVLHNMPANIKALRNSKLLMGSKEAYSVIWSLG
jgi:hypothetical protein